MSEGLTIINDTIMPIDNRYIVRGGYTPFGLNRNYNLDVLGKSLDKMDAAHQKALEQATAIDLALSKLELNAAEDEWKANYINDIRKQIDSAAQFGNYSTALTTATKMAGKALSDPGLLGRVRANANYEEAKKQILARNDINQVTKDRWLEQNPYAYQDKYDANGNVVGGTDWNPNWRPVSRYDMANLYGLVKQLAAEEAGGGESAQFLDENGNLTSDPSKGFYGMAIKRGSDWYRLSEDKLKRVFDSLFKQAPEAMDALLQDMDDRHWQYEKADDEGKKAFIGSDIMDSGGHMYTPQEYLEHRVNPVLKEMAYNRVKSTVDFGSAYSNYAKARSDRAVRENQLLMDDLGKAQTFTTNIETKLKDTAGNSYAIVNDALKGLSSYVPTSVLNNLISNGDYERIANYAEGIANKISANNPYRSKILTNVELIRREGGRLNDIMDGFTKEEKDAFRTKTAMVAGIPLQDAKTNSFTRKFANRVDNLFSYTDASGRKHNVDKIKLVFNNNSDIENLKANLGLSDSDLQKSGITFKTINGMPSIEVDKHSGVLRSIATHAKNFNIQYEDAKGNIVNDYSNGSNVGSQNRGTPWGLVNADAIHTPWNITNSETVRSPWSYPNLNKAKLSALASDNDLEKKLDNVIDNAFKRTNKVSVVPLTVRPEDDHTTLMLREAYLNGIIGERADYTQALKEYQDNNLSRVSYAMYNPGNLSVYAPDEDGNTARLLPTGDKRIQEIADEVISAIADGRAEIAPANPNTPAGYGTIVKINPKENAKGETIKSKGIFYFDGLLQSPAATAIAQDPARMMEGDFEKDRGIGRKVKDVFGNYIDYDSPTALQQYSTKQTIDAIRHKVMATKADGKAVNYNDLQNAISATLQQGGLNPDSDVFKIAFEKVYSECVNM